MCLGLAILGLEVILMASGGSGNLRRTKNQKLYVGATSKDLIDARLREKFYKSWFGRKIRNLIVKYIESNGSVAQLVSAPHSH